jgi:hypothetical protein
MKYQYKVLFASTNSTLALVDQLNEWGSKGWRLVSGGYNENGDEWALIEKQV